MEKVLVPESTIRSQIDSKMKVKYGVRVATPLTTIGLQD